MLKDIKLAHWLYASFAIASVFFLFFINNQAPAFDALKEDRGSSYEFIDGYIEKIGEATETSIPVTVKANTGVERGRIVDAPVSTLGNFNHYQVGDHVLVYKQVSEDKTNTTYETTDYYHQDGIGWLFWIFVILAIVVARIKGLTAIVSVIMSIFLFYFVFLKMLFTGFSPLLATLVFTMMVTVLSIPLIHGFNKKSLSSIIAIFGGYVASLMISFWFKALVQVGNTPGEEFRTLAVMVPNINLSDILIASLFLGAVGALIDTSISISSAIFEALKENKGLNYTKIYRIGMAVGEDVLGSMINTLLFAYIASSLPFLILLSFSQGSSISELINSDFIALELTRTFIGAVSLVIVIPITAMISAYFLAKTSMDLSQKKPKSV